MRFSMTDGKWPGVILLFPRLRPTRPSREPLISAGIAVRRRLDCLVVEYDAADVYRFIEHHSTDLRYVLERIAPTLSNQWH